MSVRFVVDASAVLAWLLRERGENVVEQVLPHAALSTVNLTEVLYKLKERGAEPLGVAGKLQAYGLTLAEFTVEDAELAQEVRIASVRVGRTLSLGDCCCIATALRLTVPAVASDQAWEVLNLGLEVMPFR